MSTDCVIVTPQPPSAALAIAPVPRCSVSTRLAVKDDLAFIDYLMKMHSHMVGFASMKQLEQNVANGDILIADDASGGANNPIGYCLFKDTYMKREDVGIIYHLNVLPLKQRHLVGAALVKAAFERSAYGCKLYCCWCAQDIQANWFWESIGFIPLAFRTGSRAKQRIHIFWQRRVRDNDDSTPYWFPSKTENGAVAEDRIVLPIPPDTHWRDAKPIVLPGMPALPPQDGAAPELPKTLPGGAPVRSRPQQPKLTHAQKVTMLRMQSKHLGGIPIGKKAVITGSGVKYVDRPDYVPELDAPEELLEAAIKPTTRREKKPRQKNDPQYVKFARELRDRFLEEVNVGRMLPAANGKYDVSRQLAPPTAPSTVTQTPLLDAA